jgi:hypothetical protein
MADFCFNLAVSPLKVAQTVFPSHPKDKSENTGMDIYGIVTETIINLLEQGVVPWRRPRGLHPDFPLHAYATNA